MGNPWQPYKDSGIAFRADQVAGSLPASWAGFAGCSQVWLARTKLLLISGCLWITVSRAVDFLMPLRNEHRLCVKFGIFSTFIKSLMLLVGGRSSSCSCHLSRTSQGGSGMFVQDATALSHLPKPKECPYLALSWLQAFGKPDFFQ